MGITRRGRWPIAVVLLAGVITILWLALRVAPPPAGRDLAGRETGMPAEALPGATGPDESGDAITPETPEEPGETGIVTGTVLDVEGRPVPGAVVLLGDGSPLPAGSGTFRSGPLPSGEHAVAAAAPGHPPVVTTVAIAAGDVAAVALVLVPGGLSLGGRVVTEDGVPIHGARVRLARGPGPEIGILVKVHRHETESDGTFLFGGLPPGRYALSASAPLRSRAFTPEFEAGRRDVEIVLRPAGEIVVDVIDSATDAGVPGRVAIAIRSLEDGEWHLWWDLFDELPARETVDAPGRHRVSVRSPDGRKVGTAVVDVCLGASTHVTVRLEMSDLALEGTVVADATGEPVAGAFVAAMESDASQSLLWVMEDAEVARLNGALVAITDAKGRYRIEGVTPGAWQLAVRTAGYRTEVRDGIELPGPAPEIRLTTAGSVEILVLEADGRPAARAYAYVELDAVGLDTLDADVEDDGRVTFESLPPGRVRLSVQVGSNPARWTASVPVTVVEGETLRFTFRPPRVGGRLVGRVTRAGEPQARRVVSVEVTDPGGVTFRMSTLTDADGRYVLENLPPGRGAVRLGNAHGPAGREVEITAGESTLDLEIPSASIRLRLTDARTGRPVCGYANAYETGPADGDGRIELREVGPETMSVVVSAEGYAARAVPVRPAEDPAEIAVALVPANRVEIRIVDVRGRSVRSSEVALVDTSGWDAWPYAENFYTGNPVTGRRVFDLAPGTYALRVTAPGHRAHASKLVVPAPDGAVSIVLEPE